MSRPATAARRAKAPATRAGAHAPRPLRAAPPPRRVSGPARPAKPRRAGAPATAGAPAILVSAAGLARTLPDSKAVDRLIRGRTWVAVIAVALIGIVAMQVHMLGLNAGIGRAVEKASTLEQQNTTLRLQVSRLSSGDRIAAEAQRLGLVMPNAGEVRYGDVHPTDASRATRVMRAPDPDLSAQANANVQAGLGTGAMALAPESAVTAPGEAPTAPVPDAAVADPAVTEPAATDPAVTDPPAVAQAPVEAQAQAPVTEAQAPPEPVQQAPVQPEQQAPPEPVTAAGGAVATPGG